MHVPTHWHLFDAAVCTAYWRLSNWAFQLFGQLWVEFWVVCDVQIKGFVAKQTRYPA